jgi:nucleoside-diphosphate-sugar epimerase
VTRLGTLLLGPDFAPVFSGTRLAGEPIHYVADTEASSRWDWKPTRSWADGVDEYADWWLRAKDCR